MACSGVFLRNDLLLMIAVCSAVMLGMLFDQTAFGQQKTRLEQQNCVILYDIYKEIGESKFREKYEKRINIVDCMKLYKNPHWNFVGKSKVDKYFDSLQVKKQLPESTHVNVNILGKSPIGKLKHIVKFEACPNKALQGTQFLIKSDGDRYVGYSNVVLQNGKCTLFRAEINAKSPSSIQIEYVKSLDQERSLKLKKLQLV